MNKLNLPVVLWLAAAFLSFSASVICWFFVDKPTGLYIGLWVPSILASMTPGSSMRVTSTVTANLNLR